MNADVQHGNGVRFFRTADGKQAYGFTVGGKIYIDPRIATSETPIHEYAHLWAEALRKANPKEWQNVVELMKECKTVWEQVKKEYPELKTDDEIAEDILHIHFTSAEEVADKVMYDLLNKVKPGDANRADGSHGREDVDAANKRFNEELERYEKGETPVGTRFDLGMPSKELESAGFPYLPISMRASLLSRKAGMERYPFVASDLRGLVKAIQKPIAIFKYSKENMRNLIVDVKHGDKHFLVGVTLDFKAGDIEVNSVSGMFPKESHEWIKWIQDGKTIRIDQKKKVLDLIDSLRTNPAESERIGLNLSSATKIVEDFENPVIKGENFSGEEENNSMRDAPTTPADAEDVAKQVELKVGNYVEMAAGDDDTRGYTTTGSEGAGSGRAGRASVEQAVADVDKRTGGHTAVIDSSEVPADVVKKLGEGVKGYVKGGKAYVVADNCDSAAEAATVEVHESAGSKIFPNIRPSINSCWRSSGFSSAFCCL